MPSGRQAFFSQNFSSLRRNICAALSPSGERANASFFSHIFSPDRISQPEKRHQFSYKTFREDEQNAVCTILAYKKRGKYQPGKVMRENPPVLPLSIHNAAKSFLRTAKSILRNVTSQHQDGLCDTCHQEAMNQTMQNILEQVEKKEKTPKAKAPTAKQTVALQSLGLAAQAIGAFVIATQAQAAIQPAATPSTFTWYYTTEGLKAAGIKTVEIFEDGDGKFRFRAILDGQTIYWGKGHKAYETKTATSAEKYLKGLYKALAS